jgi:phosphoketolase
MRSFVEILNESKKTYPFKIGVAGELPEGFADRLETALQKYDVAKMSSGKKTPIQERPLDFPQLQNMEVTYFEVEVNYPTTVQVLQEYLGKVCSVDQSYIIVRNPNEPQELYQQNAAADDGKYEPMLTKEDMGGESAQDSVGSNRVMELLKELEKVRKENDNDPAANAPKGESKDIDTTENAKSPIGS